MLFGMPLSMQRSGGKRKSAWYQMLNPTYRSRCEDFKRIFKDLPVDERLIVDYSCALQRDILLQGRIYVTQNYLCFYANIFRWETLVTSVLDLFLLLLLALVDYGMQFDFFWLKRID